MRRLRFIDQEEVDIRLRTDRGSSPRRLVPWWARALREVSIRWEMRRRRRGSLSSRSSRPRFTGLHSSSRRSVVKAFFSRNRKKGVWVAHARYLTRTGAQQEIGKGIGFDAERESIDMVGTVRVCEMSGELTWRFIVSPEDADRMNLRSHMRELVIEMERGLDTKLHWVALDRHNTHEAHVHPLVCGVRHDGKALEIDREYVHSGIRACGQEIATRELGPRLEPEILRACERAILRERWTEVNLALGRRADAYRVVSYERWQANSCPAGHRPPELLERLGLARKMSELSWELSHDHERELRRGQRSKDVIKSSAQKRQREKGIELER
jgi:hypothetical protein